MMEPGRLETCSIRRRGFVRQLLWLPFPKTNQQEIHPGLFQTNWPEPPSKEADRALDSGKLSWKVMKKGSCADFKPQVMWFEALFGVALKGNQKENRDVVSHL